MIPRIMLFDQKNNKKVRIIWAVVCALVILSMLLLSAPVFF